MAFDQILDARAKAVDGRLHALLEGPLVAGAPDRLKAGMRHAVLGGGKRFRPFLVIESAALFGVVESQALDAAAALECLHCYSLVHDDLPSMDNDELRRGRPTVWKAFDEWTAVLVGDALLTLAFEVLARPQAHPDAEVRARLVAALAQAAGPAGMVGGQGLDLEAEKLGEPARPDLGHVTRLQAMKTGALIRFACEAGGMLGRAAAAEQAALAAYGTEIGLAFQISDDLLDAEGDAELVGKAVGKDAGLGKPTMVAVLGVAAARRRLAEAEAAAIAALAAFGERAETLRAAARFVSRRQQ